jgi:energy-coupling factor transporter ATP-binding protein EcfA2
MTTMKNPDLAPCIAVVGPSNSGKTTLLHLLDAALQQHPDQPLAYVVKGNPDGTGRYLFYSPELRGPLKPRVKGRWSTHTVDTVCGWIENTRRRLELVLLDFGGRHAPKNDEMLRRCSHYLVVSRRFGRPAEERREGLASWESLCDACGLQRIARVHSRLRGQPAAAETSAGLECRFRSNAGAPGDPANRVVIDALLARLLALRRRRARLPYFDLRLGRRWDLSDLPSLGGKLPALRRRARSASAVTLGGLHTPTWAYLAAMHRVLDAKPAARIVVYDPKVPGAFVEIPCRLDPSGAGFPKRSLQAAWRKEAGRCVLDLRVVTRDRFLPSEAALALASAPAPRGPFPASPQLAITGAVPTWLHMTYSRWARHAGAQRLAVWDAGMSRDVPVWAKRP